MAGERLFEFDCILSDYVVDNVRLHLHGPAERPTPDRVLRRGDWDMLSFPEWFARQFTRYMPGLAGR